MDLIEPSILECPVTLTSQFAPVRACDQIAKPLMRKLMADDVCAAPLIPCAGCRLHLMTILRRRHAHMPTARPLVPDMALQMSLAASDTGCCTYAVFHIPSSPAMHCSSAPQGSKVQSSVHAVTASALDVDACRWMRAGLGYCLA